MLLAVALVMIVVVVVSSRLFRGEGDRELLNELIIIDKNSTDTKLVYAMERGRKVVNQIVRGDLFVLEQYD